MGIFKNIKLKRKFNKVYKPFFLNTKIELGKLSLIDEKIPNDITAIYTDLKNTCKKKYISAIQDYDNYLVNSVKHNKKFNEIINGIKGFNIQDVLVNPDKYDRNKLNEYYSVACLISEFKIVEKDLTEFKDNVFDTYSNIDKICEQKVLYDSLNQLFSKETRLPYIDSRQRESMLDEYDDLINKFKDYSKVYYDYMTFTNFKEKLDAHNQIFISANISKPLFDDINGRSLDNEQRESVLTDELSTLVVAGAGSGKTLTICGKVIYLLKEKKINPNDILLLSYSKKSADDLQKKISKIDDGLTVGTFHKLGLEILKDTQNKVFMVEDQYKAIIEKYFREEMKNRPHMLQTILTYYGLYIGSDKHNKVYQNDGELFVDLKNADFKTLKNQLTSLTNDVAKKETLKKELVKSYEELAIANWYFINGIEYEYERPYEIETSTADKRQYMPDFYLPKYKLYHEHYGINKEGKAEQYEGPEAEMYVYNIGWKRNIHNVNNTTCLETYSFEFDEGTVFDKLEKELKEKGAEFHPLNDEEIFNALQSIYEGQAFKSFINLIRTFLSLYKANYPTADGFEELMNYKFANQYERQRADLFLKIVKDVYLYYMNYLDYEGKIDFDDMILQSTRDLDKTNSFKFKYIIVDEFQDISISRMKFLKKLLEQGDAKLFAVGDDWQAIYRFSGCDLNIFLKFSDYFGDSAITKITTTHRNSQELQDIAGPFIKANPEQFNKKINSSRHLEYPVRIMYYSDEKYTAFLNILREINKIDNKANVLILGRNNKDFEAIALDKRIFIDYKASNETKTIIRVADFPDMNFSYSTVHGSKGLEEDFVILLNADDSRLGFPNKMEDDELLDMVLSSKSNYEYAEERRLWYVALTRTRTYTYIIASSSNPSCFVQEIEEQCKILNPNLDEDDDKYEIKCPKCKSGRLVMRVNPDNGENFYGCSNYPYCDYSINDFRAVQRNLRCRACGDFMIYRKGQWGAFYGCHNYPYCKHKEKYESKN